MRNWYRFCCSWFRRWNMSRPIHRLSQSAFSWFLCPPSNCFPLHAFDIVWIRFVSKFSFNWLIFVDSVNHFWFISRFLVNRATRSFEFTNFLYWLLKVEADPSSSSLSIPASPYQTMLDDFVLELNSVLWRFLVFFWRIWFQIPHSFLFLFVQAASANIGLGAHASQSRRISWSFGSIGYRVVSRILEWNQSTDVFQPRLFPPFIYTLPNNTLVIVNSRLYLISYLSTFQNVLCRQLLKDHNGAFGSLVKFTPRSYVTAVFETLSESWFYLHVLILFSSSV